MGLRWEGGIAYRVQGRFTAGGGREGEVEAVFELVVRVGQLGKVPSGRLSG